MLGGDNPGPVRRWWWDTALTLRLSWGVGALVVVTAGYVALVVPGPVSGRAMPETGVSAPATTSPPSSGAFPPATAERLPATPPPVPPPPPPTAIQPPAPPPRVPMVDPGSACSWVGRIAEGAHAACHWDGNGRAAVGAR